MCDRGDIFIQEMQALFASSSLIDYSMQVEIVL